MKAIYKVTGMTCSACSAGIERSVKKLKGISFVEVSLMGERMTVDYDERVLTREEIFLAVTDLGYGITEFDERTLTMKKPQPNALKRRFHP